MPNTAIELSGILAEGKVLLPYGWMLVAAVLKVTMPEEPALYEVTGEPLKLKGNGMVCTVE
jgi:hypothetical protein